MTSKKVKTDEEIALTKKAFMMYGYGGSIEMETFPGTWISIREPLPMLKPGATEENLDYTAMGNFRPRLHDGNIVRRVH